MSIKIFCCSFQVCANKFGKVINYTMVDQDSDSMTTLT